MNTRMNSRFGLMASLLCILLSSRPVLAQNAEKPLTVPHLVVTGKGEVKIRPDKMEVTIGVVTENVSSQAAAGSNAEASQRVQNAVRKAGVVDKDIQTVNYSITPRYNDVPLAATDRTARKPQIIGYRVYNQVRVTIRNMAKMGDVLDAATGAGSNSIEGIVMSVEDQKAAEGDALEKAVQDAQRKATRLVKAAGVRLNGILELTDNTGYSPIRMMSYAAANTGGFGGGGGAPISPIAPGEVTITANVTIIYGILNL